MKISAQYGHKGTIKAIHPSAVNTEVIITLLGGVEIVSFVTLSSI